MASCINRSAPGYDALNKEFKSVTITDNVIIGWQNANNSDQFPTVQQAKEFMKDQNLPLNLHFKGMHIWVIFRYPSVTNTFLYP